MNKKYFGTLLLGSLLLGSGAFVSCADYDDDIDNLQGQIDKLASASELQSQVQTLSSQISAAQSGANSAATAAAAAQAAADAAQKVADSKLDEAAAKAIAEAAAEGAAKAAQEGKDAAAVAQAAAEAAQKAADAAQATADKGVTAAEAAQKAADAAAEAAKKVADKLAEAATPADVKAAQDVADAAKAAAAKAQTAADKAQKTAEAAQKAADKVAEDLKALDTKVKGLEKKLENLASAEELEELTKQFEEINAEASNFLIVSKRLTSLVFAPTSYINGIEAIKFVNLSYRDWSNDPAKWLTPNATAANYTVNGQAVYKGLNDFGAKVEYYVSPDGVSMDGIKDLKFLLNNAQNTRAGVAAAKDVELTFIEKPTIKDGKLVGYVKKTFKNDKTFLPTASQNFASNSENLIVASLKATIADDIKTEAEKDQEVAVYSDWTRVNEENGTPRIHQAGTANGHLYGYEEIYFDSKWSADYRVINTPADAQKYGPSAVYSGWQAPVLYNGIVKSQVYTEPLNLLDLVTVCYGNNTIIADYARYGLAFEFHLMDFIVKNQNQTVDNTNQKDFATLNGTILTSRAENGLTNNKNAVGRTPVIQAVLKDTKNNAVVDVRYLKIKWIEKSVEIKPWNTPFEKVAPWQCSVNNGYGQYLENYNVYILEQEMNDFYSKIVEGGVNKTAFYTQYPYISDIYLGTLNDDVKAAILGQEQNYGDIQIGQNWYTSIGNASWQFDTGNSVQTQNILLNFNYINPRWDSDYNWQLNRADQAVEESNFSKDGYFWFISADETERIFVPVKINVKKGSYAYAVSKEPAQWNAEKTSRVMNPQLRSSAVYGISVATTTQMIGSLQAGYYKTLQNGNKPMPATINELVNHMNYDGSFESQAWSDIVFDNNNDKLAALPKRTVTDANGDKHDCTWHVEANGKELHNGWNTTPWGQPTWSNDLVASVIDANGNIYLVDNAANTSIGGAYPANQPNAAALLLVGKQVPVKVTAKNCTVADFESYSVTYLTPLKFAGLSDVLKVYDITNNGSQATFTIGNIKLQECFGTNNNSIYVLQPVAPAEPVAPVKANYTAGINQGTNPAMYDAAVLNYQKDSAAYRNTILPAYAAQLNSYQIALAAYNTTSNQQLIQWYGVNNFKVDAANATTDLLTPGKFSTKLSQILQSDGVTNKYSVYTVDAAGQPTTTPSLMAGIKFENLEGNAIQQQINIRIPVSVDTKWQKSSVLKGEIQVSIIPTYNY